jgi:NAD(P)-dependent dehydrogenase (short-subunit alcohol dehydrogenase family)
LYQDVVGKFPEKLNTWETAVLEQEMTASNFAGWLRNKERQAWALCVPYKLADTWKACYPDFLIFRRTKHGVSVDIVDPHLIALEDAPSKAAALANFAEDHQERFGRIDLVIVDNAGKQEQRTKRLRLMDEKTRKRVMGVTTNQHLKDLFDYES